MATKKKSTAMKAKKTAPGVPAQSPKVPERRAWEISPMWGMMDVATGHMVDNEQHPGTVGLPFSTLRLLSRVPLISAIIQTRVAQAAEFCIPQESEHSLGFKIQPVDRRQKVTRATEKQADELTRWLRTCGDPRVNPGMTFERLTRMVLADSWTFDQMCIERIPTWGGKPAAFSPVDASTIRRAAWTEEEKTRGRRNTDAGYIQVIENKIVTEFAYDELIFGVRRPRTWVKVRGYGHPELEELAGTIVNLLNAEMYNANNFRHGMNVSGVLAVTSAMDPAMFRAFKREFHANLAGAAQSRKTPLIQLDPEAKERVEAVTLGQQSNRDMEFNEWISWLLRLACMIYLMDPAELGYQYGNEGQSQTLGQRGPAEKVAISRERGLRPTLRMYEEWINRWLISQIHPDFELRFVGFDSDDENTKLDRDIKRLGAFMTINEIREERGFKSLDSPVADMVKDATYVNATQAFMMQQGDEGEEGAEGAQEPQEGEEQPEAAEGAEEPQEGAEAAEGQEPPGDFDVDSLFGRSAAFGQGGEEPINKALQAGDKPRVVRVEVL